MKKAIIVFNGKKKVVEITEEFHTEYRIMDELATMALEESPFLHPPKEYAHLPYVQMPKKVLDVILNDTPLDEAFIKYTEKFDGLLADVIEKSFKVKIDRNAFYGESYQVSKEDIKNGIVMHHDYSDLPFEQNPKYK